MSILGIDIGGSGIKGALVDPQSGKLLSSRKRIETPQPATPKAVSRTVRKLTRHFKWSGPIGCGFPAAAQNGVIRTASNIDDSWIGQDAAALFADATDCPARVINDADAAGLAEMRFGAGRGRPGVVVLVTVGTGLGTAVFTNGVLLPNTELGHIIMDRQEAEDIASDAARREEDLSWKEWAERFDRYLKRLQFLFWPDLFLIGGGASKKYGRFGKHLTVDVPVEPARLRNEAGIVGAALAALPLLEADG